MAESVVQYLNKKPENVITIASNILKDAQKLCENRTNCKAVPVDVTDPNSLRPLVKDSELVISYVPAVFHLKIAQICLEEKKHMVTASYISADMRKMDAECKEKGLIFLNEVGLDPGIDHLATFKIIDEVKEKGGKILVYNSTCGGLISPESIDNPFGYKFTWTPIGALRALKNEAKFLRDGKEEVIASSDLMHSAKSADINMALNLEEYPNRDSLQYKDIYGLTDAKTVMRGTLRYKGFSLLASVLIELGLLSEQEIPNKPANWKDVIISLVSDQQDSIQKINQEKFNELLAESGVEKADYTLLHKIFNKIFKNKNYEHTDEATLIDKAKKIVKMLKWSGWLDSATKLGEGKTYLDCLVSHLQPKLALQPGERDLIVMQHTFQIQWPGSSKLETKKSTLVMMGEKNGASAMSLLVGLPTAISAQLILDGVIKTPGVVMPNTKEIYDPVSKLLEANGVTLKEESE
jgi:saccharopine dehydrogenase-like NADP-dependent oxidoreductase